MPAGARIARSSWVKQVVASGENDLDRRALPRYTGHSIELLTVLKLSFFVF
jgi:hypothetical protein